MYIGIDNSYTGGCHYSCFGPNDQKSKYLERRNCFQMPNPMILLSKLGKNVDISGQVFPKSCSYPVFIPNLQIHHFLLYLSYDAHQSPAGDNFLPPKQLILLMIHQHPKNTYQKWAACEFALQVLVHRYAVLVYSDFCIAICGVRQGKRNEYLSGQAILLWDNPNRTLCL